MNKFERAVKVAALQLKLDKEKKKLYDLLIKFDYRESLAASIAGSAEFSNGYEKLPDLRPSERSELDLVQKKIEEVWSKLYTVKFTEK